MVNKHIKTKIKPYFLILSVFWGLLLLAYANHPPLTYQDCSRLAASMMSHKPIEYQPGIDTRGRKVLPAEGSDSSNDFHITQKRHIDLKGSLNHFYSPSLSMDKKNDLSSILERSEIQLGEVAIEQKRSSKKESSIPKENEKICRQQFPDLFLNKETMNSP